MFMNNRTKLSNFCLFKNLIFIEEKTKQKKRAFDNFFININQIKIYGKIFSKNT